MNPVVFWRIIAGVAALFGIGGGAYGYDQHKKRKAEQERFRREVSILEQRIATKEQEYAALFARLGEKNNQVRSLADEIRHLREELAAARRRASA
jgi:predicted  nucleic acid-binding Zn-ribbon protein